MKRILVSTAFVALVPGPASAADLTVYEAPAPILAPDPIASSWSGFYFGVHGGYGWAGDYSGVDSRDPADPDDDVFFESDADGPVLGGQLGINWQCDWFVLGAEGDASWAGIDVDPDESPGVFNDDDVVDFLASARLRAGIGFDRLLLYATGGVGFVGLNDPLVDDTDDGIETGWTAGAGGDFLVTDNLSLGVQYLHYGVGDDDEDRRDGIDSFDGSVHTITGRVNLKFGR